MSKALMRQADALQRIVEPLLHRDAEVESLLTTVQKILKPLPPTALDAALPTVSSILAT